MKKIGYMIVLVLFLSGCASPVLETVSDVYESLPPGEMKSVVLELPQEAAQSVMESGDGALLYQCDGYELRIQTLAVGSLDEALRNVTGYGEEKLTVMKSAAGAHQRYDCVWCSAGEEGELVGRTAILDDGSYYYCVSVLAKSGDAHALQEVLEELLGKMGLG